MKKINNAKTWVEIDSTALRKNAAQFRRIMKLEVQLMGVVKSNAYGHGLTETARVLKDHVDWFGVDSIDEALALQRARIRLPILVLGYTPTARFDDAIRAGIRLTIYTSESMTALGKCAAKQKRKILIHLKLETGLHRQGVDEKDVDIIVRLMQSYPELVLEGASTHFANIEDTSDHTYAASQLMTFERMVRRIEAHTGPVPIKHAAASAATILFPETHFNLARIGIGLYGLWPSRETKVAAFERGSEKIRLAPALTWKTIVAQVKNVGAGESIGYGCSEIVQRRTKIAILPIGYWDGYDRKLSSVGNVLIHSHRCKVIGRVAMNMIIVDVSHIRKIIQEDEVVLLGKQGTEQITAEEFAQKVGTINYEVVTRINPLIPRIVLA